MAVGGPAVSSTAMTVLVDGPLALMVGVIPEALDSDSPHPPRRHCVRSEAIHLWQHSPRAISDQVDRKLL